MMEDVHTRQSTSTGLELQGMDTESGDLPLNQSPDDKQKKSGRKKRPNGVFKCDHEGCGKSFTRSEHLARHMLNHNPTVIYHCPWEGCAKSFVRSDLRERHVKRHENRKIKEQSKIHQHSEQQPNKRRKTRVKRDIQIEDTGVLDSKLNKKIPINALDSIILPHVEEQDPVNIHNYNDDTHRSAASDELNAIRHSSITGEPLSPKPATHLKHPPPLSTTGTQMFHPSTKIPSTIPSLGHVPLTISHPASPSNLISWLFDDTQVGDLPIDRAPIGGTFFNPNHDPFNLSSNLVSDILNFPPKFPNPAQHTLISSDISAELVRLIPAIADHKYLGYLEQFLGLYWSCFHVQYPILHKPSFNTLTCPPILLLSMIITGASFAKCDSNDIGMAQTNAKEFADLIAEPLRFIIFESEDFQPPSKTWIVQSLLLLECYERYSTSRKLHERGYLHHGTTIQLLRRSPGLGGNPLKNNTEHEYQKNETIWEKWIEYESVKRAALFAFYIDSTHSIEFGYLIMLYAHQIQLSLPCDDDLWESYLKPEEIPSENDSLQFLVGLKKLLNRELDIHTSKLGKKILLAGLISIVFQLQQRDLQGSVLEINELRDSWKETLSLALDYWSCEVLNGCCNSNSSFWTKDIDDSLMVYTLSKNDTRCKFPSYHMAQITLRIPHYDYYIYAGAPWRMNVAAEASDYELAEKKVHEWSKSHGGRVSVIYGYMFLFEMFLSPEDSNEDLNLIYDVDEDALIDRANVVALCTLLIWAYNYQLEGPEQTILLDNPNYQGELIRAEDGYDYLRRVRSELSRAAGCYIHTTNPTNSIEYHRLVVKNASTLPMIEHKNHVAGLLEMVSQIFESCYWEIGQEFSRLIANLARRCYGSPRARCDNMYTSARNVGGT